MRLGDVICFEVAYDDLVRDVVTGGGRLLVVQTNNATFGRSGETAQQLAMGRLRAVEHGRAVLVAATSGISAVIAPDGALVEHGAGLHPRGAVGAGAAAHAARRSPPGSAPLPGAGCCRGLAVVAAAGAGASGAGRAA